MAKRKLYSFHKTRVRQALKSSNRGEITDQIRDDLKKKMQSIIIIGKKTKADGIQESTQEKGNQEIKEVVVEGDNPVQVLPATVTDEEREESRQRILNRLLGDGTTILHDRTTMEYQEQVIHSAGVYTQPRNIITDKSYTPEQLQKVFGPSWEDVSDDFENVYDENQLLKHHDTLRVDGDVNKAFLKSNKLVIGPDFPHIICDTNRSYPSEESESYELKRISNNFVYWSIKNELQRIDKNVNTYRAMHTQLYQARGYQRGALLIERDENGIPIALKPLSALRLGRVFVNRYTWRLMGIECYDFKSPNNIILAEDLLYMTNRDYAQSIVSYLYGYSDLEFVSHLVELNLIINSIVLKEINRTHWAPYVFIQLLETEDEAQAADFMSKAKRGLSMVSLLPFKVDAIPPSHSGGFVVEEREMNSRTIISHLGMLNDLVADERSNTHANLSTKLQSYNQTDVKFYRNDMIRAVWEHQWYGRNIMAVIRRRYARLLANRNKKKMEPTVDELKAQAKLTPGELTIQEAANTQNEDENDLIIEEERRIWEINRKLQVSKVKSLIEKEIQENGLQIEESEKDKIMEDVGIGRLEAGDEKTTYDDTETDDEPFDLASELGIDMISPATEEYEMKVLGELIRYTDYTRLPFKIKMLFPNVSFDTDIEKSLATIGEFQAEIIPKERAQEKTGNEDLVEKTKEETQIKLFMAKALAPAIQEAQKEADELEVAAAEANMRGKMTVRRPGKTGGDNKAGNSNANQIDLKNRLNPMTKLRKKVGMQNYTPG